VAVVEVYWALAELFEGLLWGMLFLVGAEGMLCWAEWNGSGSRAGCSCMASSMVKVICGNWIGIGNRCWSVGTKVGATMMIAMLDVSGMYG
jgi:hypothetical protein